MRKPLQKFLDMLIQPKEKSTIVKNVDNYEILTEEDAYAIRGGDKEYIPIYAMEKDDTNQWKEPSIFLNS